MGLCTYWSLRFRNYPTHLTSKAHDNHRERLLPYQGVLFEILRISDLLKYKQKRFYMSNKDVLKLSFNLCFFVSFLFVGFQLAKICKFTSIQQIFFNNLRKTSYCYDREVTLLSLQGNQYTIYTNGIIISGQSVSIAPS